MCDASHQIYKAYCMSDGGLLLCDGQMRLAVGFIFHHPRRAVGVPVRGFAPLFIFDVVVVRLGATRFDEIFRQRQVARLLGDIKQAARKESHRLVVKRGQLARDNRAAFVRQTARVAAE